MMLEAGAETDVVNSVGRTAAQMAAFVGKMKILSFPKLPKKYCVRFWCFLLVKHYLMTCSELTHCWALFSTSHHVRVNLCSIPMFNFLKTQMILPVRTGATIHVHVCKFLQYHHFGNSRRKLVALEGSKVQHQVLIGASLVGKDSVVPGVRSSAGLCICVLAASHLLPFSSFWEREKSWNLFWSSHHLLTWTSQEQDKDLSF